MSDTNACGHSQLMGQREFCPDCGLSRTEALVEACTPFLKDDETPAECIRRNRKDVDGCLSMLIDEKRNNDALRARLALLRDTLQAMVDRCIACGGTGVDEDEDRVIGECQTCADARRVLEATA